jgi:hypothetical protein
MERAHATGIHQRPSTEINKLNSDRQAAAGNASSTQATERHLQKLNSHKLMTDYGSTKPNCLCSL